MTVNFKLLISLAKLRDNLSERPEEEVTAVHDVELVHVVHEHDAEVEEPDPHDQLRGHSKKVLNLGGGGRSNYTECHGGGVGSLTV